MVCPRLSTHVIVIVLCIPEDKNAFCLAYFSRQVHVCYALMYSTQGVIALSMIHAV